MVDLVARTERALGADGPLAARWPGWLPREAQTRMAIAVASNLQRGGVLLAEASTGSGKTLAYLVPWLLSGQRAVISTSTHVLQHQLAHHDLPRLTGALGMPARVAVLKGRDRYVCLQRLHTAVQQGPRPGGLALHARLREWLGWAEQSASGDLDEVGVPADDAPLRGLVTSTSENCLRQACPRRHECHVDRARQRAGEADAVVINHHVWRADFSARQRGGPGLLPAVQAVVFDEAQALHELARDLMTVRSSAAALTRFWSDFAQLSEGPARGAGAWAGLALQGRRATEALGAGLRSAEPREGLQPWPSVPAALLRELAAALTLAHRAVAAASGADPRAVALGERCALLATALQGMLEGPAGDPAWLDWQDAARWTLVRPGPEADDQAVAALATGSALGARSAVHVSATLGQEPGLRWHREAMGLGQACAAVEVFQAHEAVDPSAVALHVPADLPEPGDAGHAEALAVLVADWAAMVGGQVLVLTTTRRAAVRMARALHAALPPDWRVVSGTESPARDVWQALRQPGVRRPTVVVASGAFWRGVDVPGNTLRLVVVDKLPFAPPDDPWLQRRIDRTRAEGRNPFDDVQLVDAAMALRQAAGRLIRAPGDRGLLVVGDVRLRTRGYAPKLLAALQGWRWLDDADETAAWVQSLALTRASTTDRPAA